MSRFSWVGDDGTIIVRLPHSTSGTVVELHGKVTEFMAGQDGETTITSSGIDLNNNTIEFVLKGEALPFKPGEPTKKQIKQSKSRWQIIAEGKIDE